MAEQWAPSSAWVTELRKQISRGKHVLLHGNVYDAAMVDGDPLLFRDALAEALRGVVPRPDGLRDEGEALPTGAYNLIAWHNVVDGLFTRSEREAAWLGVIRGTSGAGPAPAAHDVFPALNPSNTGGDQDVQALVSELMLVRDLIAREATAPFAFVLELAEKLVSSEDNQTLVDRKVVSILMQTAERARVFYGGSFSGMRNSLILVASKLGQIPPWLYRENPGFELIPVTRPELRERRVFVDQHLEQSFLVADDLSAREGEREKVVADLAAVTDGLTYTDLWVLGRASQREELPAEEAARLVNYFRFGLQSDPWEELRGWNADSIRERLNQRVFGQPEAIEAATRTLISAVGGVSADPSTVSSGRPKGVLFLVGPTGVGKTELAKAIAELVFGDSGAMARFDMSEYRLEHDVQKFIGSPPSYVGYGEGGQLTNHLKAHPFSVLLFDEIEKAASRLLDIFLQILDDGRLTDGMGDTVSFAKSLIIFTSNQGNDRLPQGEDGAPPAWPVLEKHFRDAVEQYFVQGARPEILGRIGKENVVPFDLLREDLIGQIFEKFRGYLVENVFDQHAKKLDIDQSVQEACTREVRKDLSMGGRAVRAFLDHRVVPPINEFLLRRSPGESIRVAWQEGRAVVRE